MKPKHSVLKQVGDKLFVDVWMEPKPKRAETPGFGYTYNAALESWQKSAQTIEVHPTMAKAFEVLAKTIWGESSNMYYHRPFDNMIALGIEIPCENIEIREMPIRDNDGDIIGNDGLYAFLHQEKEEEPSESTKQTQDEIFIDLIRDYRQWYDSIDGGSVLKILKSKYTITKNLTNH